MRSYSNLFVFYFKMEVENQRRDLQEKHKLLCEALKAMEIQEDECKKSLEDKERELRDLRRHSDLLENKSRVSTILWHLPFFPLSFDASNGNYNSRN